MKVIIDPILYSLFITECRHNINWSAMVLLKDKAMAHSCLLKFMHCYLKI
jgi:hypothetical protein